MLTAIILATEDTKAITRTLNALIGATVEGFVREVVLLAAPNNHVAAEIADEAGCELLDALSFGTAIFTAKGSWLVILEAGAFPESGWVEALSDHIQSSTSAARFKRSPLAPRKLFDRLFQPEKPLCLGLIIEKQAALALGSDALQHPEILAKSAKAKIKLAALRPASNAHQASA